LPATSIPDHEQAPDPDENRQDDDEVPPLEPEHTHTDDDGDPPNLHEQLVDVEEVTTFVATLAIFCSSLHVTDKGPSHIAFKRLPTGTSRADDGYDLNRNPGRITYHALEGVKNRMMTDACHVVNMFVHQGSLGNRRDEDTLEASLFNFDSCLDHISRLRIPSIAFTPDTGCQADEWKSFRSLIASLAQENPLVQVYITPVDKSYLEVKYEHRGVNNTHAINMLLFGQQLVVDTSFLHVSDALDYVIESDRMAVELRHDPYSNADRTYHDYQCIKVYKGGIMIGWLHSKDTRILSKALHVHIYWATIEQVGHSVDSFRQYQVHVLIKTDMHPRHPGRSSVHHSDAATLRVKPWHHCGTDCNQYTLNGRAHFNPDSQAGCLKALTSVIRRVDMYEDQNMWILYLHMLTTNSCPAHNVWHASFGGSAEAMERRWAIATQDASNRAITTRDLEGYLQMMYGTTPITWYHRPPWCLWMTPDAHHSHWTSHTVDSRTRRSPCENFRERVRLTE
jgi:hypothetical protein